LLLKGQVMLTVIAFLASETSYASLSRDCRCNN
jgi:hypothetical protein